MHRHHILPRSCGGTNDPDNIIEVTVEEHAKIHHSLWLLGGRWEDKLAWQALSKQIGKKEIHRQASILGGSNGRGKHKHNTKPRKRNKQGPRTIETRYKMSIARMGKTPWNKGLTKETDSRVALNGLRTSQGYERKRNG